MKKNMLRLYDYIFHYNAYEQKWFAILRENKEKYFNGELNLKTTLQSKKITDLIKTITTKEND